MLREYTSELKNYNFLQKITQGYYLDAKDQGRWKVGQVKKMKKVGHKLCIEVMFDGYSAKYNQLYDIPSYSKLAPFRRFTLPYTGPSNQQPRREQPAKTIEHYIKLLGKISSQIENLKSESINHLLRGQIFIFVDYYLTMRQQTNKYSYQDCMRLFFAYIEAMDKIMEKCLEFLKEIEKQGNLDQNYVYVHPKMALLYSLTEFLFNCNSMISKREERVTFHSYFGKHQSLEQIYVGFVEKLLSHKIYEKCQKLISWRTQNGGKSLPWSIKKQALILIKCINPQEKIQLPKDTKQVIEFLQYLPYLTRKSVLTIQDQEKYRNQLIFHLILNGNFEGKLIGLGEIKKLTSSTYFSYKKDAIILEQIREKNLVGYFLDNINFNSQLFKRGMAVLEYGYKNKLFMKEHFALVLKLHKDKHQLELQSFYNSLAQFGAFLSYSDAIEYFQMMVRQLPFEENFIQLIKNYTLTTIQKNPAFKRTYMDKDQQGFGLIYFWQLINSQGKIINKLLISKVIEAFATLLNNNFFSKQTERFVVSSIKAIKEMKNPQSFLKVIHESLKLCKGPRMNRAIEIAEKEVNVIEAAMTMLRQQESNLSKSGFQNLFEFLEQVNSISKKGLTQNDILFLWKMDKQKSRVHLLKFLRKYKLRSNQQKSQQRIINKSLEITQVEFIIKNIFQSQQLMQSYHQVDNQHYQTIDELILSYLHNKNLIDYNYKHTIRYRKNQVFTDDQKPFLGMAFYLNCIENTKYQEVSTKAIKRLIDIFLRPLTTDWTKGTAEVKVKNWIRLSKAFDSLKNTRLKCFQIQLIQIQGRMKSLNFLQSDLIEIKVKQASTNRTHTFTLPRYTSLWKLRLQINQKFQLQNTNFQIWLVQQKSASNLERQEDLSIAFIITSKQKNGVSVIVNPSKQQHPHFKAIDKFKEELCDMIGEGLYNKNLTSKNNQKASMSLDILFNLPFLKTLQRSIQNIQFKDWNQIIDAISMKRMQYQLRIIQKVKDLKWIQIFISKNGLRHLSQVVLLNLGKKNYKTLNILMIFFIEAIKFIMKNPLPFDEKFLKEILYYEKQRSDDYVVFLLNCFTLIKQVCQKVKLTTFFQKEKMPQILETVLFNNIKKSSISQQLIDICKNNNTFTQLNKHLRAFLSFQFLSTKQIECRPFFELIRTLIQRGQLELISSPLEQLLLEVRNSDISQKSQNQVNQLLFGYLLSLYEFIRVKNVFENIMAEKKDSFFMYLLNECLFHPQNIAFRKFKSKQLRLLGFKFLEMLEFQTKKENQINKLLIPMMATGAWRKQYDWSIQPVEFVNKKFTGLKNLAATCYINSLLQQLFHVKNFSSQLMAVDADSIQDKENIVREIQNIFGFLKYSQNPSYTTASLCQTFILDGQPIDPRLQTDVDEFFHALMDKLQRNLSKINKKQIINQVFRGQFSNLIMGQQCSHTSQRIEYFLSIGLQIKNKKTIYQALDEFIKGEVLEGQNAYFCQKCDKKVKAIKRVCLKDLPQIMIVTLKRFQFDYDTMQKFKLNTYCSFPQNINFLPYTKEGLQQDPDARKEDYEYKLKGVVIHYGISQAGHYTSYVRTDQKNWNYFDDERITQFSLNNIEKQCFGGIEENPFGDDQQKKKNAYLLIYQKLRPSSDQLKQIPEQAITQSKVYKLVEEDNIKTKLVNLLFQPNIQNYMFNSSQLNARTFIIYFHTVFLRNAKRHDKEIEFYTKCQEILTKKIHAQWYLKQVNQSFLLEFVLYADYQVKYVVTSLICQAMKIAVDIELLQQCVALLYLKSIIPFVKIFTHAYNSHPDYAKYLTSINFSEVVINLIKGKEIKQTNIIRKSLQRKEVTQFGLPVMEFVEKKTYDNKDLLQAIESMKTGITLDEIKELAMMIKSKRTLKSLAIITAKKFKDIDQLIKLLDSFLTIQLYTFDPKVGEESYYGFLIQVIEQLCKIVDKQQQKRVIILAKLYIDLMRQSAIGFKSQLMLFTGLFRMALTNLVFRNCVSQVLNEKENKKIIVFLKDWLKQLPNVIQNIKSDKWGWWRKNKKNYVGLTARDVENQVKPNLKQALSLLNAIIEKHQIAQVKETLEVDNIGYTEQKYGPELVKVTRKMGFLVEVKDEQGNHRFISEDQVVKKYI